MRATREQSAKSLDTTTTKILKSLNSKLSLISHCHLVCRQERSLSHSATEQTEKTSAQRERPVSSALVCNGSKCTQAHWQLLKGSTKSAPQMAVSDATKLGKAETEKKRGKSTGKSSRSQC